MRYVLYALRKSVGDYLIVTRDTLTFTHQKPCWVGSKVFIAHLFQEETITDPALLQSVLQLYRGEFLAGFSIQNAPAFDEWLLQQCQHTFGSDLLVASALEEPFLTGTLLRTLYAHFARLSTMEQTILLHLTLLPAPQTVATLWQQLSNAGTPGAYLEALQTL